MKLIRHTTTDPYFNMAFDEYCLLSLPLEEPLCYFWRNAPSVIVGVSQNVYSEVNLPYLQEKHIALVRRVTGGGAVYHDLQNLNYTMVGRSDNLEADYPGYMHLILDALRTLGVPAEMNGRNDILVDGCKVSGYAKRVWKDRLMVHGTLLFDVDLPVLTEALSVPGSKMQALGVASVHSRVTNLKTWLPQFPQVTDLKAALESVLSHGFRDGYLELTDLQRAEIQTLRDEKFATWSWIYGRSPRMGTMKKAKWPCGTVEAHLTVERGLLTAVQFGGDFLGNAPADALAALLAGCRYDAAALAERISSVQVSDYFDHATAEDLIGLLCAGSPASSDDARQSKASPL